MKIISHRENNEAYAKRLQNCEKVATVQGFDFYKTANEDGTANYYGYIVGTADLCECILSYSYTPLDEFIRMTEQLPTAKLNAFLTIDGKLERIRQAIALKQWTSNGDALFCELVGNTALAEKVRQNRSEYQARQAQMEAERREQAEQQERERIEAEQREKAKRLEQADKKIRDGEFIEAQDFEALCEKYGVQLPIKLLGWLREWCTVVNFKQYGIKRDRYSKRNHYSTTIGEYMNRLQTAMNVA